MRRDLAKSTEQDTEQDPTAPETVAYEKGSYICQYGLRSWPGTANSNSPLLHFPN